MDYPDIILYGLHALVIALEIVRLWLSRRRGNH